MKKRVFALLLALTALLLAGCGGQQKKELPGELTQRLLSDWFDYLFACENLYGDMQWAISYIERYGETPSWDNLLRARMALYTARQYIRQREKPAETLTAQDYAGCLDTGRDLSFVQPEIGGFAQDKQSALTRCELLWTGLHNAVFTRRQSAALREEAAVYRQIFDCDLRYLALTTNYLLLEIDDGAWQEKFCGFVEENCPLIFAAWGEYVEDSSQLVQLTSDTLDALEALRTRDAALTGRAQANLDLFEDAANSGDWSEVADDIAEIEGLPLPLLCPDWLDAEKMECYYYWNEPDGTRTIPGERGDIPRGADGCLINVPEVDQEAFWAYRDLLAAHGLTALAEDTDSQTIYYDFAGCDFALSWEEGEAQIFMMEQPACFVPYWYFLYLFA